MTEPQSYQCMECTSLRSIFSSFPDLFKHEIDQLFSTILFNQTTTWLIRCSKLIRIAVWPVWNNYDCCLSKCGCWGGTWPNSFAEALTNNVHVSQLWLALCSSSTTLVVCPQTSTNGYISGSKPCLIRYPYYVGSIATLARCVYFLIYK